jgi:hypothetical protein
MLKKIYHNLFAQKFYFREKINFIDQKLQK